MDQNTIDEKGCVAYTAKGVSSNEEGLNEDLGLVALMSKIIGTRPGKKGPKVVGTSRATIEDLYTFVKENIDTRAVEEQQVYMNYLVKAIFKVRDIKDGNGERDLFYWLLLKLYMTHPELVVATFPVLTGGYNEDGTLNSEEPFGSFLDLNNRCLERQAGYENVLNKEDNLKIIKQAQYVPTTLFFLKHEVVNWKKNQTVMVQDVEKPQNYMILLWTNHAHAHYYKELHQHRSL